VGAHNYLTPNRIGPELSEVRRDQCTAFAGTGFDPHNPVHSDLRRAICLEPDALRHAIAIQQLRDSGMFHEADMARESVSRFARVSQTPTSTTVHYAPGRGALTVNVAAVLLTGEG
jgi:hypothetical protein